MTGPGPTNALEELAACLADVTLALVGPERLERDWLHLEGLRSPLARLALSRALAARVPDFAGLYVDRQTLPVAPPPPDARCGPPDDVDAFVARVLRVARSGAGGADAGGAA